MKQRLALFAAAILTTFVLVFVSRLSHNLSQLSAAAAVPTPSATATTEPPTPTAEPDIAATAQATLNQREAMYRQLIQTANQQLQAEHEKAQQAQQQQKELSD